MRLSLVLILFIAMPSLADWQLDSAQSSLHFVSTKATHVAEVHRFRSLNGTIDGQGKAQLNIDLNSVDTNIDIRDQRMKEMLFEVAKYPTATISASVDPALLGLKVGESKRIDLQSKLSLHGQSVDLGSPVEVQRLSTNKMMVSSAAPLVVNAKETGLIDGIEKLREVAGLPSISYSVVVTYQLMFVLKPD